jgi:hypothetical protein
MVLNRHAGASNMRARWSPVPARDRPGFRHGAGARRLLSSSFTTIARQAAALETVATIKAAGGKAKGG